jgi:hypothetical protein
MTRPRIKPKRKITISDDKSGKLKMVMKQKGVFGWTSRHGWKVISSDSQFVRYLIQSWDRDDYDLEIVNTSSNFVYERK